MAPETSSVPSELEGIGRQIVERCGGVPLAIVVMVGSLRERESTTHGWSEVLNGMTTLDAGISNILALSYRDLPIELKPCFLYFGMFPEDHEISAFQLINMWIAKRFIKVVGDQTLEEVGEAYLNNLVARNLIQVARRKYDGRIRSCRIHDLLHTLCNSVAGDSNFFNTQPALTARRLAWLSGRMNNSQYSQTPKLRALLYFHEQPPQFKNFSRNVRFLRVLQTEVTSDVGYSLPNDIGIVIHLGIITRYSPELQIIPNNISNLKSLMTLDLRGCMHPMLLPTCILKMKQLRHILIRMNHKFYEPNRVIRLCKTIGKDLFPVEVSLPNLQTISRINGDNFAANWLRKLRKLGTFLIRQLRLLELLSEAALLPKLEKLTLQNLTFTEIPLKFDLSRYQNLLRLRLSGGEWESS